ncbi:MAG: hypothetical protein ABJC89_23255, partial [Acidobacteriota bacterium]
SAIRPDPSADPTVGGDPIPPVLPRLAPLPKSAGRSGARVRLLIMAVAVVATATATAFVLLPPRPAAAPVPALSAPAPVVLPQPPAERSLVGTLDRVNTAATEFVVNSAAGKQTFHLEPDATIRQGSKTIKPAELAAHKGERVKVRYRENGGARRAEFVVLATPAPHPSKTRAEVAPDFGSGSPTH